MAILAALCRVAGIHGVALPSSSGAALALTDAGVAAATKSVGELSKLLGGHHLVLVRRGPTDDPTDSDVQAARWQEGQLQDRLAPGLIVGALPDDLASLLLTGGDPAALVGAVETKSLSRWAATKALAAAGRNPRGQET